MALFIARFIMAAIGIVYTILGLWMTCSGILNEFAVRTFIPMLTIIGVPPDPPDEQNPDEIMDYDYVPFTVSGLMLAIVGITFLINIP